MISLVHIENDNKAFILRENKVETFQNFNEPSYIVSTGIIMNNNDIIILELCIINVYTRPLYPRSKLQYNARLRPRKPNGLEKTITVLYKGYSWAEYKVRYIKMARIKFEKDQR